MSLQFDHPIYSGTEEQFWQGHSEAEYLADQELGRFILETADLVEEKAESALRHFVKAELIGVERLNPGTFLFRVFDGDRRGFLAYLDYTFPAGDESGDEYWWVIVACPDAFSPILPLHLKFNVWRLGLQVC